jgi:hypothetical protein
MSGGLFLLRKIVYRAVFNGNFSKTRDNVIPRRSPRDPELPIFMSFPGFRGLRRGMTGVVLPRVF